MGRRSDHVGLFDLPHSLCSRSTDGHRVSVGGTIRRNNSLLGGPHIGNTVSHCLGMDSGAEVGCLDGFPPGLDYAGDIDSRPSFCDLPVFRGLWRPFPQAGDRLSPMVERSRTGFFQLEGVYWSYPSLVFLLHLKSSGQPEAFHPEVPRRHAEDVRWICHLWIYLYLGLRYVGLFY